MLDKGQAGLIVLYATNMADQIASNIKAVNRYVSDAIDADADELAKQLTGGRGRVRWRWTIEPSPEGRGHLGCAPRRHRHRELQ